MAYDWERRIARRRGRFGRSYICDAKTGERIDLLTGRPWRLRAKLIPVYWMVPFVLGGWALFGKSGPDWYVAVVCWYALVIWGWWRWRVYRFGRLRAEHRARMAERERVSGR